MIWTIRFNAIKNIENKIQIAIAQDTKVGEKIVSETLDEYTKDKNGNDISITHPGKPYLWSNTDNYFLMKGSIKTWFKWEDGDPFQEEHVDDYVAVQESLDPDFVTKVNYSCENGQINCSAEYAPSSTSGLTDSILHWRPKVSESGLEILTDNTVIVCPMQHEAGWTFKHVDVMNGDSITITKQGTDCYLMSGEEVTVGSKTVAALDAKKLTSDSITLTNNSGTFTKVILVYK